MSQNLEWAGIARGTIVEHGVKEFDSGAVAIAIVAKIKEYFDADLNEWINCESNDFESFGDIIIVKKDGTPNSGQVESLCKCAGWSGDLMAVGTDQWQPTPCQFTIKLDEYNGTSRYKISWLNDYDRMPGSVGNVSPEKARALQDRFGPQFRALAGNVQRNAAPPAGKPPAPAKQSTKPAPGAKKGNGELQGVGTGAKTEGDDSIPF